MNLIYKKYIKWILLLSLAIVCIVVIYQILSATARKNTQGFYRNVEVQAVYKGYFKNSHIKQVNLVKVDHDHQILIDSILLTEEILIESYNYWFNKEQLKEHGREEFKKYLEEGFNQPDGFQNLIPVEIYEFEDSLIKKGLKYYHGDSHWYIGSNFFLENKSEILFQARRHLTVGNLRAIVSYSVNRIFFGFDIESIYTLVFFFFLAIFSLSILFSIVLITKKVFNNKSTRRNFLIGLGGFILILALTNPSLKDFKEHGHTDQPLRESNFLIFSIYSDVEGYNKYLGILKNFILI